MSNSPVVNLGPGGGGGSTEAQITQAAHGLSVLDVVYVDALGWQKAIATGDATLGIGIVTAVASVDTFTYAEAGRFTIESHGLTVGVYYYLSMDTAGLLVEEEPQISQPIVYVEDANTIIVLPYRAVDYCGTVSDPLTFVSIAQVGSDGFCTFPLPSIGCVATTTVAIAVKGGSGRLTYSWQLDKGQIIAGRGTNEIVISLESTNLTDIIYAQCTVTDAKGSSLFADISVVQTRDLFDVLSIPNLYGWWDAANTDSIVATGNDVSQWLDSSPNGNDLTTIAGAPKTGLTVKNGNNAIDFDGASYLNRPGSGVIGLVTIAYAAINGATSGAKVMFDSDTNANGRNAVYFNGQTATSYAGTVRSVSVGTVGKWVRGYTDFTRPYYEALDEDGAFGAGASSLGGQQLSDGIKAGVAYNNTSPMQGSIGEMVVIVGTVSEQDKANLDAYLEAKWLRKTVPPGGVLNVEYLLGGGGGGAGCNAGGGGSGAQVLTNAATLSSGQSLPAIIGVGGAGTTAYDTLTGDGTQSEFNGDIALPGIGGANYASTQSSLNNGINAGRDGYNGSGGGSGYTNGTALSPPSRAGIGTLNNGGVGDSSGGASTRAGAGGGGMGGPGSDYSAAEGPGPGGAGIEWPPGSGEYYGGGGYGGSINLSARRPSPPGSTPGVGNNSHGTNGALTCGGSASAGTSGVYRGGTGGGGVLIVRYPGNEVYAVGGEIYKQDGYVYHKFTTDGDFTVN
jgi:hypothetical protein